jgi:hypothetical protein
MEESFKFYLILFLLCHFIGDYYLQTEKMAQGKGRNFQKIQIHGVFYSIPFAALLLIDLLYDLSPIFNFLQFCFFILIIVVSHFVIDVGKGQIEYSLKQIVSNNKNKMSDDVKNVDDERKIEKMLYIADQFCHIGVLVFFSVLLSADSTFFVSVFEDIYFGLKAALFVIIIIRPTNITFKRLFSKYQPQKTSNTDGSSINENEPILGAGSVIGTLERLLMGIFVGIGQFAAVGLIMTAKSIARYDRISKNPQFAEYYLIGTLYSILVTVVVYILLFNL